MHIVKVANYEVGQGHPMLLMAGPCVLEGYERSLMIGQRTKAICDELGIPYRKNDAEIEKDKPKEEKPIEHLEPIDPEKAKKEAEKKAQEAKAAAEKAEAAKKEAEKLQQQAEKKTQGI